MPSLSVILLYSLCNICTVPCKIVFWFSCYIFHLVDPVMMMKILKKSMLERSDVLFVIVGCIYRLNFLT